MADFNPDCADWVFETISKMDDDAALAYGLAVAHDLWSHDMAANERFVRTHQARQDQVYTEDVAKALLAHLDAGGDPAEAVAVAAAVSVAKADHDLWRFQERDKGGRFGRMTGAQYRAQVAGIKAGDKKARADLKAERKGYLTRGGAYTDVRDGGRGLAEGAGRYAREFNRAPNEEMSGATDTFGRLSTGGQLVQQLGAATGSNKTAIAGAVANYAGQFGPEAEKVVGPSMRRAAYRYRGTERTPDRAFVQLAQQNLNGLKENGTPVTPELKTFAAEQSAVQYFLGGAVDGRKGKSRIPSARLASLHQASGRITPSEGIMIDAQGNIAHQAVGFGEDHYLPFNLKNIGALKGGSYVRTRESGGLTTEDLYTGLLSGARSMTVVSNSGVFTIDFDDDLRGGRRYNDKARQMVGRYASTLDAIKSEKVANPERSLSSWEKAQIRVEAEEKIAKDPVLSTFPKEQREEWIAGEVRQAQDQPKLSAKDLEEIETRAKEQGKTVSEQEIVRRSLYDEKMDALSRRNYRLDGDGYATAMQALQEQFPYYIADVHHRTVNSNDKLSQDRFNRGTDSGYVKPRFNRPEAARAGYFDESITGQGKRGADQTAYQNYGVRRRGQATERSGDAAASGAPSGETKGLTPDQARAKAATNAEGDAERAKVATAVGKDAKVWLDMDGQFNGALNIGDHDTLDAFNDLDDDGRQRFLSDPTKVNALSKDLDALEKKAQTILNDQALAQTPRNRKNVARKAKSSSVNSVVPGVSSPVAPPALTGELSADLAGDEVFQTLLKQSDDDLRSLSDQLRGKRQQTGDAKFDDNIRRVETARAVAAKARPEMTAEQFQTEAAKATGTLKPLPKISAGSNSYVDNAIKHHMAGLDNGHLTHKEFRDRVLEVLQSPDADHMSEQEKAEKYNFHTGNRWPSNR